MKQNQLHRPLALMMFMASIIGAPAPVSALVFDSTYNQAVSERDQARRERDQAIKERDEAFQKREEAIKDRISDLKRGNPAEAKQLEDLRQAAAMRIDDARQAEASALARTVAEQQQSGKWRSIAFAGTASCFLIGIVAGVGIGTKTRHDHQLQQTSNVTAGADVKE